MILCPLVMLLLPVALNDDEKAVPQTRTVQVDFQTHDGHPLHGKLVLPDEGTLKAVVVAVQTAEGSTVDLKRALGPDRTFCYYDLYREKLPPLQVGFFSYEGRGIRMGDKPPRYEEIDRKVFDTSTLDNKVRDLHAAIRAVRTQPGLAHVPIFALGASEGTLLAAQAAARYPDEIQALILYGVLTMNMRDNFRFILTDGAFMAYCRYFDANKDGKITKEEFEADPFKYREKALSGIAFEKLDQDGDGLLTVADLTAQAKPLLDALDHDNFFLLSMWAKRSAGVSTPEKWFKDHFEQKPIWEFLKEVDLPVGCFHGAQDSNTPISGVRKLEEQARAAAKSRMRFFYFEDLDHSLNISRYFATGKLPTGHAAIFKYIDELAVNPKDR